jgi:glycosyltransferase involved in cell wall biosynthesis
LTATRTKRILSVQPVSDGGGSEHALIGMVRQLAASGWECHIAVPGLPRLANEYAAAGATLHVVPMQRLTTSGSRWRWLRFVAAWPLSVARLAALARRVEAEVVHSNSLHSWYGWAAAALDRVPHVWHAREIVFQSGAALRVERYLASRHADAVVAVSGAVGAQLDPHNVVVITDEADTRRFDASRAGRFRGEVGIADDAPVAGSIARLDTWKGFDVLLDAFASMREALPGVLLVIAGSPVEGKERYAAELEARARATDGVFWLGHRSDIGEVMADLDVFVQVSTEPEPFGLVVVEALASGVPVVAGAAGGPLEILGERAVVAAVGAGRLVEPGDADALTHAVLDVLAGRATSTAGRRLRRPLRDPVTGRFAELFDEVATRGRRSYRARSALPATSR